MCVKRWTESAEEASSGAELVVEAILEDLQVRSFEALVDVVFVAVDGGGVVAVDGGGVVVVAILEDLQVRSFEALVVVDGDVGGVVVEAALEDIQVSSLDFLIFLLSLSLRIFANQGLIELKVKRDLFARIDAAAPSSTILASNTSR